MQSRSVDQRYFYRFEEANEAFAFDNTMAQQTSELEGSVDDSPIISTPGISTSKPGFWRRQFSLEGTSRQRKFDWVFGVFLPLACFYFDPFVFRGSWGSPDLGKYQIFAYTLAFLSIMSMAAWLLWGERLKWINGWLAGVFLTGSVISLMVGVCLFPISLMGLVILIGALGLTPLFASFIYLRNAFRAIETAGAAFDPRTLLYVVSLSGSISLVVPYVINNLVGR